MAKATKETPKVTDFEKLLIKEYAHWKVYLYPSQYYLGRVYIWAKREGVVDFFDMTKDEREEYFEVGKEIRATLKILFSPDLFNYATLGNEAQHLHTHVIPRYSSDRKFAGVEFHDGNWGKNYAPYDKKFALTEEQLQEIRVAIRRVINVEELDEHNALLHNRILVNRLLKAEDLFPKWLRRPKREDTRMDKEQVIGLIGEKNWDAFCEFMNGQTMGMRDDKPVFYRGDVENFMRKITGKPFLFD